MHKCNYIYSEGSISVFWTWRHTHVHFGDSTTLTRLNIPHGVLIMIKPKVNLIFRFVCTGFKLGMKSEVVSDFPDKWNKSVGNVQVLPECSKLNLCMGFAFKCGVPHRWWYFPNFLNRSMHGMNAHTHTQTEEKYLKKSPLLKADVYTKLRIQSNNGGAHRTWITKPS